MFSCEFCEISKSIFFYIYNNSGGYVWKHNLTMRATAEFASNLTANIKLSKHLGFFFLLTSNKFFTKSKTAAAKKIYVVEWLLWKYPEN